MRRPTRSLRQFGPREVQPKGRFEIVRARNPPEPDFPSRLVQSRRSTHVVEATQDQYVAAVATKLIGWVGQATIAELHALSARSGYRVAVHAHRLEERARREFGEGNPFYLMYQDFNRQTLSDYFNHLMILSDGSIEVLRRVVADNPYYHNLPEERRGFLRRLLDQFKL